MSQLENLIHKLQQYSNIAVIGMGVSNIPLIKLLLQHNLPLTIRDKKPEQEMQQNFTTQGARFITGENYLSNLKEEIIFRTPGVSPNSPELKKASENKQIITSEMQEFFNLCPCPIIAVTGSDGKTTTTTLISQFLKSTGKKVFLGGNIGTPLLCEVDQMSTNDIAVVELSSFQLMDLDCNPQVSVITNLSPNHLDYHKDMEEYVMAKSNIFLHQSRDHKLILNLDNEVSQKLRPLISNTIQHFGRINPKGDLSLNKKAIIREEIELLPLEDIKLKGVHNIENYMAAILAVEDYCTVEQIRSVAQNFTGVEHRMQPIRTLNGVTYYNDSIGTSPSRTIAGLRSFDEPIILIAGGYDKGIPFDELGEEIHRHVKYLLLVGTTTPSIESAVKNASNQQESCLKEINILSDLTSAVILAQSLATANDNVVLSPACAAFDQYKNFAQRGKHFEELVNQLK